MKTCYIHTMPKRVSHLVNTCQEASCKKEEMYTIVDIPEEICDLQPRKFCRMETKLVPRLKPAEECTNVPQEICDLKQEILATQGSD